MKNQQGLGHLALLLVIVVAAAVGFAGWWVWQSNDKNNSQPAASSSSGAATAPVATEPDPTAKWKTYTSKAGKFTLKYPKTWEKAANQQNCTPGLVMFGGDSESVGICGSEYFGQMYFMSMKGNTASDFALTAKLGYKNIKKTSVTVDGAEGTRYAATFGQEPVGPGDPAKGTKQVVYTFYTNGRTYVAYYSKTAEFPNVLDDFELMVTKTVQFSN